MDTVYYLNILIFSIITIPYFLFYIKKYKISPVSVFLFMEMSMFYGICFYKGNTSIHGDSEIGIKLECIYVISIIFFILGVEFSKRIAVSGRNSKTKEDTFIDSELSRNQMIGIWCMIGVSVAACLYLFIAGGANLFIRAIMEFLGGTSSVYRDERLAYGSVAGVGYIYQFRVVILPLLTAYIVFASRKRYSPLLKWGLFVFMIISILGTGQRNAFVFYAVILFLYYLVMKKYKVEIFSKNQILIFGGGAIFLLAIMTIANGRISGDGNPIIEALKSILDRILFVNQGSALTCFSYMDSQETVWGYDWLKMIEQILPGKNNYVPIDNISYHIEYGTYAGTNPPCLWGSAWYNFNIFGVTLFPLLVGFFYQRFYKKMRLRVEKNRLYVLFYVALCVYLGIWTYGTPMTLFNQGVVTVLLMRWIIFKVL